MPIPGPIDISNPVDRSHAHNRGRKAWFLALPQLSGGSKFVNLMRPAVSGTLTGTLDADSGWRPTTRPGGFAEVALSGLTVQAPHDNAFGIAATGFTLGLSFKFTAALSSFQSNLLNYGNIAVDPYTAYMIRGNSTDKVEMAMVYGTTYSNFFSASLVQNQWYRGHLTSDGTTARGYIDGVEFGTSAVSGTPFDGTGPFWMGDDAAFPPRSWPGSIDDVSIWSRDLGVAGIKRDLIFSRTGYLGPLRRLEPRPPAYAVAGGPAFQPAWAVGSTHVAGVGVF